jgi:hypothetical protein
MKLFLLTLITVLGVTNSCATSSRGEMQVQLIDGNLCFNVQESSVVKLSRLTVNQISGQRKEWNAQPDHMWIFGTKTAAETVEINPQTCLPYGQTYANMMTVLEAKPLKMQTAYYVFASGKPQPNVSNTLGYSTAFCLIASDDGKTISAVTAYDHAAQKWRDSRCSAKAPQ